MDYASYVTSLTSRYPSLTVLAEFLGDEYPCLQFDTGISVLKILKDGSTEDLSSNRSDELLSHVKSHLSQSQSEDGGLVVLLEDPSAAFVKTLGPILDINPLFFAGHIATFYEPIEKRPLPPVTTMFPSQVVTQNFIHLHSQRVIDLGESAGLLSHLNKLIMSGNIRRNVRRTQALSGRNLGILRVCTSILYKELGCGKWVSLILVDSTSRDITVDLKRSAAQHHNLRMHQIPRRIRVEDFREIPLYSAYEQSEDDSNHSTLLNSLSDIFKAQPSNMINPSLFKMAYYPIRLMMTEWMLYAVLMESYVKFYEYTFESINQRPKDAENQDFKELHRWRRSSKQSLRKLHSVENFVVHWQAKDPACQEAKFLLQDIRYIVNQIEDHRSSLESMVAIMTSVIQLTDSRRSIEEAFNIRRLTYIALVFIPLSFTSSIFSMGDDFGPGKGKFWIYFATAIPLLLVVLGSSMAWQRTWNGISFQWRNRGSGKDEKSKV